MSDFGDYLREMDRYRTSDAEIEKLFSGSPVGEDLSELADLFGALRVEANYEYSDTAVATFVEAAVAEAAAAAPPEQIAPAAQPPRRTSMLRNLRRRAATLTVAASVVVGGTGGLAVAADGAKPGDALYGIDRALEAVGIGAGAEEERLSEAEALVAGGDVLAGLEHAAEALDADGDASAAQALNTAADRIRTTTNGSSDVTRERVAGLLAYLSENIGDVDGRQVAELAVEIGRDNGQPPTPQAPAVPGSPSTPTQRPVDPPGLTDNPGLTNNEPGPPEGTPSDPPGQDKDNTGPPDGVPANPPGQDKDKPPKDKDKPNKP